MGAASPIYLATTVVLGAAKAFLLVFQAFLLATIIAGAFVEGKDLAQLAVPMEFLLAVFLLRSFVACARSWRPTGPQPG